MLASHSYAVYLFYIGELYGSLGAGGTSEIQGPSQGAVNTSHPLIADAYLKWILLDPGTPLNYWVVASR